MRPKRFSVKYFVQGGVSFDLAALIPVFQRWIQQRSVEGLLIDVANYQHVFQGPGVVLIGHEADYSFDLRGGRPGLLYTRKRALQETLSDDLRLAFRLASAACKKLEAEAALNGIRFGYDEAEITFLDRLSAPNTPEALDNLRGSLREFVADLYHTETVLVETIAADPRQPLTVRVAVARENVAG